VAQSTRFNVTSRLATASSGGALVWRRARSMLSSTRSTSWSVRISSHSSSGYCAVSRGSSGAMYRRPKVREALMRSRPLGVSPRLRTAISVLATASRARRACWWKTSPDGVSASLRVERSNRRAPNCRSRSAICLLIWARVQSSRRAASAMLPVSTTLTKLSQELSQCICQLSVDEMVRIMGFFVRYLATIVQPNSLKA